MLDRLDDLLDQQGPVVHHIHDDIGRQRRREGFKAFAEFLGHHTTVLTHQHEGQAEDDLALTVRRNRAAADLATDCNLRDILNPHRRAVAGSNHDVLDLTDRRNTRQSPHHPRFTGGHDLPAADVGVVAAQRIQHILKREAKLDQCFRFDDDVILPLQATPRIDLGHTRHLAKLGLDHPIMDGPEFFDRVFAGLRPDNVVKDLTETGRDRAELRPSDTIWQFDCREPFGNVLPRVDNADVIIEGRHDL